MLEGPPGWGGEGAEEGSHRNSGNGPRPRTASRGLEEAAPSSACAGLRSIFSSSAEELRCERLRAAWQGREVPVRCGVKPQTPAGRASTPLLPPPDPPAALPGAPLPGHGGCESRWAYWGYWCPTWSGWPGDALPGFSCPDRALSAPFTRARSRGGAGCPSVCPGAQARRSSSSPNPLQRNPPPGALLTSLSPLTPLGSTPPPPASRRGTDTRGPPPPPTPRCSPRGFICKNKKRRARRGGKTVFPCPGRQGPRETAPPSAPRPGVAPSPAPPAAATAPLQLAARLFCLIKLNVSVNFPPGRAALPLPEPPCWLQMSTRPVGAAQSPWGRVAPATRGRGLRGREDSPLPPPQFRDSVLSGRAGWADAVAMHAV